MIRNVEQSEKKMITSDELLDLIRSAASQSGKPYLSYNLFRDISGVPMSQVFRHFDSWTDACNKAGVCPGQASPDNITPKYSKGKGHALNEVIRVAKTIGDFPLTKTLFDKQDTEVKACTVSKLWGGWRNVINAAGLNSHPNFREEIPLDVLAHEFRRVVLELKHIPTVNQLIRRSRPKYCKNTYTRKFGSYTAFKKAAINHLLKIPDIETDIRHLLEEHMIDIIPSDSSPAVVPTSPHHRGRHLGFRAFAFAPTYETGVVALFGSVSKELGFEIVAQREAYPDIEARRLTDSRRQRYAKCLIEVELRSSDYKKHKHPIDGCDLIVCWIHDWNDCPIEVLELSSEIKKLSGW